MSIVGRLHLETGANLTDRNFISTRAAGVDASGIRKVFDLAAKLKDPINLSIGLPDFDVPDIAKQAAIEAIEKGQNRYTQTQGIAPLRDRLRKDLTREFGKDVGDVLITSGVSGGLLLAMMAVVNPGDEVVFLDPYFVMYRHILTLVGGVAKPVDSYPDFRFDAAKVEAAITPKTKVLILNSPSNPTGIVMTQAEVKAAVELARKHDLLIVSDEIYEPFLYESGELGVGSEEIKGPHAKLPSAYIAYEKTVVLRGFSKSHAMTGWRLGYAFGYEPVVSQMTKLQQYTFVCAPSPLQYAALAAMDVDMAQHVDDYRKKRDIAYSMLSRKFDVEKPGGAFYIFPKVPVGTATDFCTRAIEKNVLIIPGNVFSAQDTHFRISYATTDTKLAEGCEILLSLV
jgi:aspartate/methionine/tyrosine aminotransferase